MESKTTLTTRVPRVVTFSAGLLASAALGFGVFYAITMGMAAMAGLIFSDFHFVGS